MLDASPILSISRLASTVNDPYKQGQYSNLYKVLQEEQALVKEIDAALNDIRNAANAPASGAGRGHASVVSSKMAQRDDDAAIVAA